jgi:dTDP-4-dehydrorhamnose reductase
VNSLELWGGYECTVNRVGDQWFDQTKLGGHEDRPEDLQLFAALGMRSIRYPALWERISPDHPELRDFQWTDERFAELRRLGLDPIVTLCHHGSGPHYTSLVDASFAPGLARHAAAVASRYPWIRDYTPVNEPLTTARFSALYGLWYPHSKDEGLFWTALLNEIDATQLSMREIRKINPEARLVQTDDLGYCHATEPLQAEADYQNERRWIGWDLLCGMVVPGHALWDRIAGFGLAGRLNEIAADPCPPDIIGINHYLSSERLLEHRVELYPNRSVADRTVALCAGVPKIDVDAIRHREEGVLGLPELIEQAWHRYGRTIAITECHNGATREEQVRWFLEVWDGALALRAKGVDLCAVTAWSLLGSHDWNHMVTRFVGHYETGVYDVRTGTPRPTLLASVLTDLSSGRQPASPGIAGPGWWRRESRLVHAAPRQEHEYEVEHGREGLMPLVIANAGTMLGSLVARACELRGLHHVRCGPVSQRLLNRSKPWALFDAGDPDRLCGGGRIALPGVAQPALDIYGRGEIPFVSFSGSEPWIVEQLEPHELEIRTGRLFMPWDPSGRAVAMLDSLDAGRPVTVDSASLWEETYGPDAVDVALDLLLDGVRGAVEVRRRDRVSTLEFARALAIVADRDPALIRASGMPGSPPLFAWAPPPSYLPPLETTLERFVREARAARGAGEKGVERRDDEVRLEAAN